MCLAYTRHLATTTFAIVMLSSGAAVALDSVKLGKAVPNSFAFGAVEVGIEAKIFEREGIEVEITSFRGDAQMQQALTAGSLDVGLGSGPALGFRAKGAPAIGVAAMYGPPANLALVLPLDTPIKALGDLRGKRIGVTTASSLTDWLVRELSRQQGWVICRLRDGFTRRMKMIGINRSPASAVQEPRPAAAGGWPVRPRDRIAEDCRPGGLREIGPCHRGEAC